MKFIILFLAVVGAACAAPSASLAKDFRDFLSVLPVNKIRQLALDHLENDKEYQAAVKYMQDKEYKTIAKNLKMKPSMKEMRMIVIEAGLDLELIEGTIEAFLESLYIVVPKDQKKSFGKFIDDLGYLIPFQKLTHLVSDKLENSAAFKKFFDVIFSERMHTLFSKALRSEEYKVFFKEMISMDVSIDEIIDAFYELFGWKSDSETINDIPE